MFYYMGFRVCRDTMAYIPAGDFPYQNTTTTYIDAYYIDKYEITNQEYCLFLNATDSMGTHWYEGMEISRTGTQGSYQYKVLSGKENYPIRYVIYADAEDFATWRSVRDSVIYRLPTEQEWEKAAAWDPAENYFYLYGCHVDTVNCDLANINNCVADTTEVGHYNTTSYYGCYDMCGNLWEWTSGIEDSTHRRIRGGNYTSAPTDSGTTTLAWDHVESRNPAIGFRLVRTNSLWSCGNGLCEPGEEGWCPDCPPEPICGDGICDSGEEGWCEDCGWWY